MWARHKNSRDPAKIEAALLDHAEKTERHRNAAIKCLRHCRLFFDGKGYHPDEATERELIKMELDAILAENVKEHATLSAGASVDHGVKFVITEKHVNWAADRGCCVSTCCASSLL